MNIHILNEGFYKESEEYKIRDKENIVKWKNIIPLIRGSYYTLLKQHIKDEEVLTLVYNYNNGIPYKPYIQNYREDKFLSYNKDITYRGLLSYDMINDNSNISSILNNTYVNNKVFTFDCIKDYKYFSVLNYIKSNRLRDFIFHYFTIITDGKVVDMLKSNNTIITDTTKSFPTILAYVFKVFDSYKVFPLLVTTNGNLICIEQANSNNIRLYYLDISKDSYTSIFESSSINKFFLLSYYTI